MRRARIAVFGVSSSPNAKEPQGSLTKEFVNMLKKRGARIRIYDPFFSHTELLKMGYSAEVTLAKSVEGMDCIIIAVGHDRFRRLNLRRVAILSKNPTAIVDMGNVVDPYKAKKEGLIYRGIGRGTAFS